MTKDTPQWGTIAQAAEILQVSTKTVRRMIARGDVEAKRFGPRLIRVNLATLDAHARTLADRYRAPSGSLPSPAERDALERRRAKRSGETPR